MLYFATPSSERARQAMSDGLLGCAITPAQGKLPPEGALWCADSGCGPGDSPDLDPGQGYPGDLRYLAWLARLRCYRARCVFATAPDIICDARATLARSKPFLPVIRAMGYRAALVAQNGIDQLRIPWDDFDCLFLGGDDAFKLGPVAERLVAEANGRDKWTHMGRVNSDKRSRIADRFGCDSVDGTYLRKAPDKLLPKLLRWMDNIERQQTLF